MVSPTKDARADRLSLPISPEKHEKRENSQDHEDLAKTLNNLSATLRYVSTPAENGHVKTPSISAEKDHVKPPSTSGDSQLSNLVESQLQRIKENRERALARRAQILGS